MATIFNLLLCYVLLEIWELSSATRPGDMISVKNGEKWGNWGPVEYCAEGDYAAGFSQKIESPQFVFDDTALNSIVLKCKNRAGKNGKSITSAQGWWGDWFDMAWCKNGDFLTAFGLRVESHLTSAHDETAVNRIIFRCRALESTVVGEYELKSSEDQTPILTVMGTYGYWSESCKKGKAICGIQTKIEPRQYSGDDSALNDVRFYCC